MKIYSGRRTPEGVEVTVWEGTNIKKLPLCLNIRNHSPTGFEWGYGGSGPAQLALAILCHFFGKKQEEAISLYQDFKWQIVANFHNKEWELSESEIREWVQRQQNDEKAL